MAINAGHAIVGTTSIYTFEDESVNPEPYSSILAGASDISIQRACGPLHVTDHLSSVLDALAHGWVARVGRFDKSYCLGFKGNHAVNLPSHLEAVVRFLLSTLQVLPQVPYVGAPSP
jgi:hypothetical protein